MMERNASTRAVPPEWADRLIMSLRCCGLRPSGPPAEPQGKDWMALTISSEVTGTLGSGSLVRVGITASGFKLGCFCCKSAKVVAFSGATM